MHARALVLTFLVATALAGCTANDNGADVPPLVCPAWSDVAVSPDQQNASEVSLAINPTNPQHIVAASNAFGIYTSLDGGVSWVVDDISPLDLLQQGRYLAPGISLSDPAVAFGPDGTLHVAALAYIPGSAVVVFSRSTPDGPWTTRNVWVSEVVATFNDKEWLAIDPLSGTMIVAWQREPAMDMLRTLDETTRLTDVDVGLVVTSRSTDGGQTWSLPVVASDTLHANGTQLAWVDGVAHLLWVDYEGPGLKHAVSPDGGASWGTPQDVSDLRIVPYFPQFSRMHTLPGLTAAPDGRLAAVWHDSRNDAADVLVSLFDGRAWSPAERLPDDPLGSGRIQFYPWAAYDGAGLLHVTYYSGATDGDFTYRHLTRDAAGEWSQPQDLSQPFPVFGNATAPAGDIGDYTATAALGGQVHAAWAQPGAAGAGSRIHVATLQPSTC